MVLPIFSLISVRPFPFVFLCLLTLAVIPSYGQNPWIEGVIVVDSAEVYKESDFGSKVLGRARKARKFLMSPRPQGAFYKIQISKGVFGFVADTQIRPVKSAGKGQQAAKTAEQKRLDEKKAEEKRAEEIRKKKPFHEANHHGVSLSMIRFREETMGLRPTDQMLFIGYKAQGEGLIMEGSGGELNFKISTGPPRYYEQATGVATTGFVLLIDGMLSTPNPQGKNTMTFFGFGPFFKYSKIDTGLVAGTKTEFHSLNDMALGATFNYGIAQRIGGMALRFEFKYYWEKMQYYGLSLTGQWLVD